MSAPISRQPRDRAYTAMASISFDGMQVRRDIGWRAPGALLSSYADAGVDIDEGARAVEPDDGRPSSAPTAWPS